MSANLFKTLKKITEPKLDYTTHMRKQRALTQKLYLIETLPQKEENVRDYIVMGSTGNVYQVSIKGTPSCSCPDNTTRKKICKHIFFILVKIMNCTDPDKGKYTDEELKNMFNNIPNITKYLCVDDETKKKYDELKNKKMDSSNQKDTDDDVCPICLEDLKNGEDLDFCKFKCGKNIHKNCFAMINMKKLPQDTKCVFCQHPWNGADEQKYINLTSK